jgi:hypothetical protein
VVVLTLESHLKILGRAGFLFLAIVLFAAEPAGAQQVERRGFIGLGIGPSFPVANFADALPSLEPGGRTTTGYTDTLVNLSYRFRERFGLAVAFSYSEYPVRGDDDDWWQVAGVTGGPMYSLPLVPRSSLDLKAMLGMIVLTPVVDNYTTGDGVGVGLGFDLRATFRYDVFRRWALFVDGGLHSSNVSFDATTRTDYRALISGVGVAFRPTW